MIKVLWQMIKVLLYFSRGFSSAAAVSILGMFQQDMLTFP